MSPMYRRVAATLPHIVSPMPPLKADAYAPPAGAKRDIFFIFSREPIRPSLLPMPILFRYSRGFRRCRRRHRLIAAAIRRDARRVFRRGAARAAVARRPPRVALSLRALCRHDYYAAMPGCRHRDTFTLPDASR